MLVDDLRGCIGNSDFQNGMTEGFAQRMAIK